MGSSVRIAGVLSGAALAATMPSTAQAQPAAEPHQTITLPCSGSALAIAVNAANAIPATLRLAPKCSYKITATLTVSGDVTLLGGPGTAIRPATAFTGRLLDVTSTGRLSVRGVSILSGKGNSGDEGIGIRNAGNLVLNFVTISGNTANNGNGAALSNLQNASASISHTLIIGNNATGSSGAGTGSGGGVINRGTLTITDSRLSANTVADGGGAIDTLPTGNTHIAQSTLDHNVAGGNGGGLFNSGITSLDHTLVVRNHAGVTGGGVFQNSGTITVNQSIISDNTPNNCAPAGSVPTCSG
ncbi:hypothetical protein NE236_25510 [Actinoallomurus purpureus]|uniref:hypothetical protein n=1 Tax=Actinoallomurus purpureus TaxID=478114 RepID=UPI0020924211|nr:hypothetical protein [Actinoallomurus purpureus]MCO6008340.1 hypothetical protein [Actinoallomurus purpureus]